MRKIRKATIALFAVLCMLAGCKSQRSEYKQYWLDVSVSYRSGQYRGEPLGEVFHYAVTLDNMVQIPSSNWHNLSFVVEDISADKITIKTNELMNIAKEGPGEAAPEGEYFSVELGEPLSLTTPAEEDGINYEFRLFPITKYQ